ncbi:hypothetical protein PR202_gb07115 [Eleusine coracana subsp. coracana]|uniref:Cytochrome b5 heme-binding domain-containing protein n=1 Tax=Eleusine coracana subsp. coracana TaxID=191504 RepID=A0AAV5EB33_ELECO|nr:hypothetical protein PR202_gb07115 [Eleusine coracana subsp. coracana]
MPQCPQIFRSVSSCLLVSVEKSKLPLNPGGQSRRGQVERELSTTPTTSPASSVRASRRARVDSDGGSGAVWETLKQAIVAYTGLSPAAFFTAVAVAAALYHVVSGLFAPPPPPPPRPREEPEAEPLPPPVQLGEVTEEELKQYDGSDPKKPLLMAIKGQIYDVTQSRSIPYPQNPKLSPVSVMFYGPGGPYALFAGKDASRALAKMSFEPQDLTGDITGLGPFELDALQDWEYKFMSKYVKVGTVKKNVPVEDGNTTSTPPATNETVVEAEPERAPVTEEKPREAVSVTEEKPAVSVTEEKPSEAVTEEVKEEAPAEKETVAAEVAELWAAARGAHPLTLLAGAAAVVAIYKVASGLLAPPPPPPRPREIKTAPQPPIPEPVEVGEITEEELRQYDGSDPEKPLLVAIKGQIYDVSQSRMFYGPGGAYESFAGRDASRALAKMSFEPQDLTGDISGLTPFELSSLNDWEYKFISKYVKVGTINRTQPTEDGFSGFSPEAREEAAKPVTELEPEIKVEAEMNKDDAP